MNHKEVRYTVWSFKEITGCYDCGNDSSTMYEFPCESVELSEDEFNLFSRAVKDNRGCNGFRYLYKSNQLDEIPTVQSMVEEGRKLVENEERKLKMRSDRVVKQQQLAEKKKVDKEKRIFEQLKQKFEK